MLNYIRQRRKACWHLWNEQMCDRWHHMSTQRNTKKTWISPNGRDINQTEHIIINGKLGHSLYLENVIVRWGADVGSDHHLLQPKTRINPRKAIKWSEPRRIKCRIARLKDPGIKKNFSLTLRYRLQTLGDVGVGLENNWSAFRRHHTNIICTKTRSDKDRTQLNTGKLIDKSCKT